MGALVSLCEVTPGKAADRQRAQASSAAFGMCVRSGTRVEGRSMISRWGSGWIAPGATRCRPGGDEAGVYRANLEGAVNQSLVGDLTFLETSGVLLHEGF